MAHQATGIHVAMREGFHLSMDTKATPRWRVSA
jgi:hypothetical protein